MNPIILDLWKWSCLQPPKQRWGSSVWWMLEWRQRPEASAAWGGKALHASSGACSSAWHTQCELQANWLCLCRGLTWNPTYVTYKKPNSEELRTYWRFLLKQTQRTRSTAFPHSPCISCGFLCGGVITMVKLQLLSIAEGLSKWRWRDKVILFCHWNILKWEHETQGGKFWRVRREQIFTLLLQVWNRL